MKTIKKIKDRIKQLEREMINADAIGELAEREIKREIIRELKMLLQN